MNKRLPRFAALILLSALVAVPALAQEQTRNPRVPATVRGYETADIYARVSGYIDSVDVDLGDRVADGETLALIQVPELEKKLDQKNQLLELARAERTQAVERIKEADAHYQALRASVTEAETMRAEKEAMLSFEQAEYDRIARLASTGSVKGELLDSARYKLAAAEAELGAVDARVATANANWAGGGAAVARAEADAVAAAAQVDVAQADLDYAQQMIDFATIKAPWRGKVTRRMFDSGAFVQSADGNSAAKPILTIVRDDMVRVSFSLSQKDIARLETGISVTFTDIDALPDEKFEGTITRFSAELDEETRMMRVEMDLDNSDGKLRPGYFGYVTVHFE